MDDIFHTQKTHYKSALNQATYIRSTATDSRVVGFSLNYRFGKDANARKRDTTGSAEDEKGRAN